MLRTIIGAVVLLTALAGCTAVPPVETTGPPDATASAPEPGPAADSCEWFNRTEPDSWTPADPDLLAGWGVTGVAVPGGCQQVTETSLQLGWYGADQDVCNPVMAIVQPQLDAAGYVTADQTPDDALTQTLQATSADGSGIIAISCSLPAVGDDYEVDGSVTLMAYHP
jgi:hypothetical protein